MSERPKVLQFYYNCRFEEFQMFRAIVPNHYKIRTLAPVGPVAQRLEQRTHNPLVLGSNPSGPTNFIRSGPNTWVTQPADYMGDTFGPNGFSSGSTTRVSRSTYP